MYLFFVYQVLRVYNYLKAFIRVSTREMYDKG